MILPLHNIKSLPQDIMTTVYIDASIEYNDVTTANNDIITAYKDITIAYK